MLRCSRPRQSITKIDPDGKEHRTPWGDDYPHDHIVYKQVKNMILCSTGALIGKPNGRDYRLLKPLSEKLKCDGFEFMMYSDWYDKIDDIVDMVADIGLKVPVYHAQKSIGENISKGGPEELKDAFERFRLNCDMAARMGAEIIVIHL